MTASHPTTPAHVLLVAHEDPLGQFFATVLGNAGYTIRRARTGIEALTLATTTPADLVLLDLRLPDTDSLVLCATLAETSPDVPIITCGPSRRATEHILSLKLGADDFLHAPIDPEETRARVAAVLRRAGQWRPPAPPAEDAPQAPATPASTRAMTSGRPSTPVQVGALLVDDARQRVTLGDAVLSLSGIEYRLLLTLGRHAGQVVTREELLQRAWRTRRARAPRLLDAHLVRLRRRLASGPAGAPVIVTVRGQGYKLVEQVTNPPADRVSPVRSR